MCPEAVDGTLTSAEQQIFDKHIAGCVSCSEEFAEAHRGAVWMQMLKGHSPEPPAALLQKILAGTSAAAPAFVAPAVSSPVFLSTPARAGWFSTITARLGETFSMQSMAFQPRMAMTAAMAFFSIALTLNMAGVRISGLRLSMLRPSSIQRSVADAGATGVRSFQNLRVVYEFESRISDMRSDGALGQRFEEDDQNSGTPFTGSQQEAAPKSQQPAQDPAQQPRQEPKPQGSSQLVLPVRPAVQPERGV
jgi:hypothetical protein